MRCLNINTTGVATSRVASISTINRPTTPLTPVSPSCSSPSAVSDSMKFSRFICAVVYQLLGRLPSTTDSTSLEKSLAMASSPSSAPQTPTTPSSIPTIDFEFAQQFQLATNLIHRLLRSTAHVLPLPIVVLALKLVHRVATSGRQVAAHGSEPHLFAVALTLAQKITDDHAYTNRTWSKLMGLPADHLSKMEREFLACIRYDLYVGAEDYATWFGHVQALARHWEARSQQLQQQQQQQQQQQSSQQPSSEPSQPSSTTLAPSKPSTITTTAATKTSSLPLIITSLASPAVAPISPPVTPPPQTIVVRSWTPVTGPQTPTSPNAPRNLAHRRSHVLKPRIICPGNAPTTLPPSVAAPVPVGGSEAWQMQGGAPTLNSKRRIPPTSNDPANCKLYYKWAKLDQTYQRPVSQVGVPVSVSVQPEVDVSRRYIRSSWPSA